MWRLHLDHIEHLDQVMTRLDEQVNAMMTPFHLQRDLLTTVPGIDPSLQQRSSPRSAPTSPDGYFPDAAHLASLAGICPGNHESVGKRHTGRRRHGNLHLQAILVEAALAAVRHPGYLQVLYHRQVMKEGGYRSPLAKKNATIVVAHAITVIIWHILATGKP